MNLSYVALFLISAAALAFQVVLTRFFALAQGHHFAFMAISLALLGIGASGTYLSLRKVTAWERLFNRGALLFTLSLPLAYLVVNYLPFDAYTIAWERAQLLWLALYYLTLTIPFFFSGLVIGVVLAAQPDQAGPIYAANLLGSGLGPLLALLALAAVGGPGTVFMCTLLGWLAVASVGQTTKLSLLGGGVSPPTSDGDTPPRGKFWSLPSLLFPLVALLLVYLTFRPPAVFEVRLTPYKSLSQTLLYPGSEIIFSRWNAFSRVDVLRSEGIRSAPGLSFTYAGELPPQLGLLVDGDNLSPVTGAAGAEFTRYLPLALAFELRPDAQTLILEPGGGLAVLAALEAGARTVTVVHSNPTVAELLADHLAEFNDHLYKDRRVTVVVETPRSFLRRSSQQFDLIILPLTDSFRPVTAGAYTLGEDYRYTVEAFSEAFSHLSPNGLLVAERWLQLPPSESLRLWGTAIEALRRSGLAESGDPGDLSQHPFDKLRAGLFALRSLQTSLVGAGREPLTEEDLAAIRNFATRYQFDMIWLPGLQPEESNRFSLVPGDPYHQTFKALLTSPNPETFYGNYAYAVAPPTDDQPFFFHFFKWGQTPEILQSLGRSWQPFGGSGYLVLVVLLGLVVILSLFLILLPLLVARHRNARPRVDPELEKGLAKRYLAYFALLGLGFLFVEVPLLQHFILYLGQPAYAFAVVVSALLVAAGLGSRFLAGRLRLRLVLLLITGLSLAYPLLLPYLFSASLPLPFAGRVIITVLALAPLGLLLGIPFPAGLRLAGQHRPDLVPWLWAVNGCSSVISAVLAVMVALTWGFSAVVWSAALAYGLAAVVISRK